MTKRTPNKAQPRTRAKKKSPATNAQKSAAAKRPGGKLGLILDRLERTAGATLDELVDATGWQKHSVHGALTLNMLLSFAQFEREVTGERIRDKIAASKKKGMWMGGNVPLGYVVKDRKLLIDAAEAKTVRHI